MRIQLPLSLLAAAVASSLFCAPAHARLNTYVANSGTDVGACSLGAPCKSFGYAISQVQAGGVVTALDSAGYSAFTIDKAVTITAPAGVSPLILAPSGGAAITINASSTDVVTLRGLTLNGAGSGGYGVNFTSGYKLAVINCFISNYTQDGILVNVTATSTVLISNTAVSDTPEGVVFQTTGNGAIIATIDRSAFDNNSESFEMMNQGTHNMDVLISNSDIGANTNLGIYAIGNDPFRVKLSLKNVTFNNMFDTIDLDGATELYLSQVTQRGDSQEQVICTGGGNNYITSDGTNHALYNQTCPPVADWTSN